MIKRYACSLLLSCLAAGLAHAQPQLHSDTTLSSEGYFQLSWQTQQEARYELQQARNASFSDARTLYQGRDNASVISGLADGQYYYRLRSLPDGSWSEGVAVEVKHHPLSRAFGFFTLGAAMFLATVGVLIKGARSRRT